MLNKWEQDLYEMIHTAQILKDGARSLDIMPKDDKVTLRSFGQFFEKLEQFCKNIEYANFAYLYKIKLGLDKHGPMCIRCGRSEKPWHPDGSCHYFVSIFD